MQINFKAVSVYDLERLADTLEGMIWAERELATRLGSFPDGMPRKDGYSESRVENCSVKIADMEKLYQKLRTEIRKKEEMRCRGGC